MYLRGRHRCAMCMLIGFASLALFSFGFYFAVIGPTTVLAAGSEPDAPGSISGTVKDLQGKAVAGITVDLYASDNDDLIRSVSTDAAGKYKFMVLGPGEYRIGFQDKPSGRYLPGFYNDAQSLESAATLIILGNSIENINVVLTKSSIISGRVSMSSGNLPAQTIASVTAYKKVETPLPHWQPIVTTQPITGTGIYTLTGLTSGTYRVCAITNNSEGTHYLVDCYGNVSHVETAQDVVVGAEKTVGGIDILMDDGSDYATISGKVTTSAGNPLPGTKVSVHQLDQSGNVMAANYATVTDSNGNYKVENLISEVASYFVYFSPNSTQYSGEYYDNAFDSASATRITPASREVITGVNAMLDAAAQISGAVTLQGELPSQEGTLYALRQVGNEWQTAGEGIIASGSGQYIVGGLPAGTYHLCASFRLGNESLGSCFGGTVPSNASDITVNAGDKRVNINFDVSTASYESGVSGKVTFNGAPVIGIRVDMEPDISTAPAQCEQNEQQLAPAQSISSPDQAESIYTFTDIQGNYRFQGLRNGHYKARFSDPRDYFATEYYQKSTIAYDSTMFELQCGAQLQKIDRVLSRGGAITGSVHLAIGTPVKQVSVSLFRKNQAAWDKIPFTFYSDENGNYAAKGLLPGVYRLYFHSDQVLYPFSYVPWEYYSTVDPYKLELAKDVTVVAGETTANINLILGPDSVNLLPLILRD